jgi:hypothetical protein
VIAYSCKGCVPRWRPCHAIVNEGGAEGGGDYPAGATVSLYGLFTASGNKVIIEQTDRDYRARQYTVTAGASGWSESENRISFALPAAAFPGRALLYVIDAEGRETSPGMEIKIR